MIMKKNRRSGSFAGESENLERRIRELEESFRTALFHVDNGMIAADIEGSIVQMNPAAEVLTGWKESEAIGRPVEDVCRLRDEKNGDVAEDPVRRVLREGRAVESDNHILIVSRDGREQFTEYRGLPVRDEQGNPRGVIAFFRDITEKREAQVREEQLNRILQAIRNMNRLITDENDPERLIEKACEHLTEKLGYYHAWIALLDEEGGSVTACTGSGFDGGFMEMEKRLKKNECPSCMKRILEKDELLIVKNPPKECPDCPLADKYGGRAGLSHSISRDERIFGVLTASVPAVYAEDHEKLSLFCELAGDMGFALSKIEKTEALDENREKYRILFDTMVQGVIYQDAEGKIVSANPAAEKILGLSLEEMLGRNSEDKRWKSIREDGSEFPGELHPSMQALRTGESVENEVMGVFNSKLDEYRWIKVNAVPLFKPGQDVPYQVYTTFDDFTERKKAEDALKLNEEKFRMIAESSAEDIWQLDPEGNVTYASPAVESIFGYSAEEAMRTAFQDFFLEEDGERAEKAFKDALSGKEYQLLEFKGKRKNGEEVPIEVSVVPIIRNREIVGVQGIARNITQRKLAETALEESERRYGELFETSRDGFVFVDAEGHFIDANESYCEMLGYTLDELKEKKDFYEITPERWRKWEQKEIWEKRLMKEGYSGIYEKEYIRKDGTVFPVELQSYAFFDDEGNPEYLWGIARDITERKQSEKALRESEERFRALVESAPMSILLLRDGKYIYGNPESARLLGYESANDIVGMDALKTIAPEFQNDVLERMKSIAEGEDNASMELRLVRPDGGILWTLSRSVSVQMDGQPTAIIVGQDITKLKQAEEAHREAMLRLKEVVRASNVGLWDWDLTTNKVRYSPEWKSQIGYEEHEIGDDFEEWRKRVHPDDLENALKGIQTALEEKYPDHEVEFRFRHKNGSYRWILTQASIMYDESGRPVRMLGSHVDITDRKKAERALRESQANLKALIENTDGWIWSVDRNYRLIVGNSIFHNNIESVRGRSFAPRDDVLPDDFREIREKWRSYYNRALSGENFNIENKRRYIDSTRYMEYRFSPIRSSEGVITGVTVFGRDITERKIAEEKLKESESRYRELIDTIPYGVEEVDLDGRMIFLNDSYHKILGYGPDELIGKYIWDNDPTPEDVGRLKEYFEYLKREQPAPEPYISKNVRKDGKIIEVHVDWNYKRDQDGNLKGFISVVTEITERKRAEEALKESEKQKKLILNSTAEMVAYYDTELTVIWANRAAGESVGKTPQELVGRHCYEIWNVRNEPCPGCPVIKARDEKIPVRCEMETPDGRYWSLRGYPVLDDKNEVIALVEFGQDITEQKKHREEKARLEEQFHQAQKLESVGRLAGGVAHDLNNLLSPILGYSEILLMDAKNYIELKEPLEAIINASMRARDMVKRLLAFSRKQTLDFKQVDMNRLLKNFEKLLRRTIREDITIHVKLAPALPSVKGDAGQLEQVVMNLAVNAQDAMPSGGDLTLETAHVLLDNKEPGEQGPEPGEFIMLAVSDTGCGIDDEIREHLFEPFFTTKDKDKGTGLGLATVYGIVKQHGGDIVAHSEPGKGAVFKVYLPVSSEILDARTGGTKRPSDLKGTETVLLTEDDENVRKLAMKLLKRQGYKVIAASGGKEALEKLKDCQDEVHLLLTDVIMPEMNGKELYEKIKEKHPNMKVLYMSGYTNDVIAHCGVLDEGIHFIQKPFSIKTLAAKIRETLDE